MNNSTIRRVAAATAAVCCAGALATGCGSSGDPLTESEYAAKATKICDKGIERVLDRREEFQRTVDLEDGGGDIARAKFRDGALDALDTALDDLDSLTPPPGLQFPHDWMVTAGRKAHEAIRTDPAFGSASALDGGVDESLNIESCANFYELEFTTFGG
ncbi:MAG: hypothetical protein ACT4PP_14885 [Sporichthyaceae bacterium]